MYRKCSKDTLGIYSHFTCSHAPEYSNKNNNFIKKNISM